MIVTRMLRDTNDTVLMATQYLRHVHVRRRHGAVRLGDADALRPDLPSRGFGAVSIVALFCINRSLKLAPASVVVPYQYTLILWAVLLGWRVFGEVPDGFTLAGAAIIVAAGLYIFWREQIAAREQVFTPPPHDRTTALRRLAGIGLMVLGIFLFCCNDALGKWLLGTYSVWQMLVIRSSPRCAFCRRSSGARAARCSLRRGLDCRSCGFSLSVADSLMFFFARDLPAARRHRDVLSGGADLRDGDLGAVPEGARRLAALERGRGRLHRRDHRAAAIHRDVHLAGADRDSSAASALRCSTDRHPHAARHLRHRDGERAVRRDAAGQRRGRAVRLDRAERARFRPDAAARASSRWRRSPA